MKESFFDYRFQADSQHLIAISEGILDDMQAQGYTLTLRQLYYQLVAKGIIPNSERSYKSLSKLMTRAREGGLIDWSAIEDRGRECVISYMNEDPDTVLHGLEGFLTYDLWIRQRYYVEVWVEKDALVGVIEPPCKKLQVPYMACKGYLSVSEAYRAGQRFARAIGEGQKPILIHLGDHDPSGLDMTRDNGVRLETFARDGVVVKRIALNMDQIEKYKPPTNPAKFKDPRARDYIKKYGKVSWELDALTPNVIADLIKNAVTPLIDVDIWKQTLAEQEEWREKIRELPHCAKDIWKLAEKRLRR